MNMSAVNLVSCWTLPLIAVYSPTSESGCVAGRGLATGLCAASVLSVLLIGFDQYLAILDPLHYHSRITCIRSVVLVSCCWLLSGFVGLAGSHAGGWPCSSLQPPSRIFAATFAMFFFGIVFFVPFALLCWMYAAIYYAARSNSRKHGYITPEYGMISMEPKSNPYYLVHNLRHRISNASMFRYREEARAARVSALVIATGLACWFPFSMMLLLESPVWEFPVSPMMARAGVTLLALSSVLSALLFAHRNQRIRNDIRKIFGLNGNAGNPIVRRIVADTTQFHVLGSSFSSAATSSTDNSLAESV
ncbi:5-hydroxytryptamine receptor 7 [Nilaparvata lugens]|uniref:5-hydroxytryptamine receptor 7 n=1 Tax=Nilaparvata lugens TaxID=108931 RepID=UPI00193CC8B1|nr:5-hydroxytryptamine receptor 7 [Nilaparvata lugens]